MTRADPSDPTRPPPPHTAGGEAPRASSYSATRDGQRAGEAATAAREGRPGSTRPTAAYDPRRELKAAAGNLGEIVAYARQYVAAKVSGVTYGIRKLVLLAMLGAVAGLAGVSILVTSAALLVIGIAQAIATPLPQAWKWVGPVAVGLIGAGGASVAVWIIVRRAAAVGKRMAVEQYRLALQRQRKAHGTDAFTRNVAAAVDQDLDARQSRTRTPEEIAKLRDRRQKADEAQRQVDQDFQRLKNA